MIYTTTITSASLRLRETRLIAGLLCRGVSNAQWNKALIEDNLLQLGSEQTIKKVSGLIRRRLEPMGLGLWQMVKDGSRDLATQAAFSAAVKDSRILGDFLDTTIREQRALFAPRLEARLWLDYIAACRGRDPDMPDWSDETVARLRSAVFAMMAEAGYVSDTRTLALQNVFIDARLRSYLEDQGEAYVLRCIQVAE